jgi:3-oxoacyl-[acyl-carrier protein] reductase
VRLKNKICLVTGASDGLGSAAAALFAREGAKVVAVDRSGTSVETTTEAIVAAGGQALAIVADVTKADDVENIVERTIAEFGPPNVLLHASGIDTEEGKFLTEVSEDAFERTLDVNLKSLILLIKQIGPKMIETNGGAIIATSSAGAYMGGDTIGYAAAKSAIVSLTRNVAVELAPHNIRVNAICPGAADLGANGRHFDPSLIGGMSMLGRLATADEIAHLALFLASDESSYSTASTFFADGGWTAMRPGMAVR